MPVCAEPACFQGFYVVGTNVTRLQLGQHHVGAGLVDDPRQEHTGDGFARGTLGRFWVGRDGIERNRPILCRRPGIRVQRAMQGLRHVQAACREFSAEIFQRGHVGFSGLRVVGAPRNRAVLEFDDPLVAVRVLDRHLAFARLGLKCHFSLSSLGLEC